MMRPIIESIPLHHGRTALKRFLHTYLIPLSTFGFLVLVQTLLAQMTVSPLSRYTHDVWQTKEGLPQNSVNAIIQSKDGYIWFATEEGLVRFDGVRFTVFDKRNTKSLTVNYVLSLYESSDSSIWIGTNGGGLTRLKDGQFTTFTVLQGLSDNVVRSIVEDRHGTLWLGTSSGVVCLKDGRFTAKSEELGITYSWINKLLIDRSGALWIGTNGGGLARYPVEKPAELSAYKELCGSVIMALHEDELGNIWVGAEKGALTRISSHGIQTFTLTGVRGIISAILVDHDGAVWIGTEDGVLAQFIEPDSLIYFSRTGASVSSLFEDKEGNLWVGRFGGGLHRIAKGTFTTYTDLDGLPSSFVQAVCPDLTGNVWVGTMGGLGRFSNDAFAPYVSNERMPIEGIMALHAGRDGSMWIGTSDGLSRIRNGKLETLMSSKGIPGVVVRGVDEDRDGNIWLATRKGLLVSSGSVRGVPTFVPAGDSASALRMSMWCVHVSRNSGDIWVSTSSSGLVRITINGTHQRLTRFTTTEGLSNNVVRSIYEDDAGTLWFGTYAGGLNRFKDGTFTTYITENGLFDDNVFAIVEDNSGNLWMSCNRGVFRASKQILNDFAEGKTGSISCVSYGTADGMKTFECNGGYQPSGCKSADGRLWFATINGTAVVDPNHLESNATPPPVVIEYAEIDKQHVNQNTTAHLPPGNGELQFTYTALSYIAPERVRFKYRLEGFDKEWIDAGSRRLAYYTNIPPGDYTFRVIASNNDGIWNETGAEFTFHLAPHFYQTLWFYALCIAIIALLGSAGYHFYRTYKDREDVASRLQAQLAQAELQVLKMQLQPHFLFNTLHAISSLMHKDLDAADEMMSRLGDFLRYTLESIGSQEVELRQELEMLDHYLEIEQIRLADRLTVRKEIPPELLSALVPNLILQPIVENAIRYGIAPIPSGGCIEVTARQEGSNVRISICDDGPGLAERSKEGVGLTNTRARLEQLYGTHHHFAYANRAECGMCVTLEFPLRMEGNADNKFTTQHSSQSTHAHR